MNVYKYFNTGDIFIFYTPLNMFGGGGIFIFIRLSISPVFRHPNFLTELHKILYVFRRQCVDVLITRTFQSFNFF